MPERRARVLIVDDSVTMRRLIRATLMVDPRLEVVGEAGSAVEARDAVRALNPDVMTLDVEMPNMSGLEFLRRLLERRPMPVVMISSVTSKGSCAAVEALSLGAIECIEKPRGFRETKIFEGLAEVTWLASKVKVVPRRSSAPTVGTETFDEHDRIVLIGGSTGGVEAIEAVLAGYPKTCPPTLITQHMPASFLASFAARLNANSAPEVRLAREGDEVRPGRVLIAPGGDTHLQISPTYPLFTRLVAGPPITGHRPSVDALFSSAVPIGDQVVAVMLTGMGADGARSMRALRKAGARTIGQSAESCVVFGMPRVAGEMGAIEQWVSLDGICEAILKQSRAQRAFVS